nr:uncharacterized protein LOC111425601 [Onthophagus taurus]
MCQLGVIGRLFRAMINFLYVFFETFADYVNFPLRFIFEIIYEVLFLDAQREPENNSETLLQGIPSNLLRLSAINVDTTNFPRASSSINLGEPDLLSQSDNSLTLGSSVSTPNVIYYPAEEGDSNIERPIRYRRSRGVATYILPSPSLRRMQRDRASRGLRPLPVQNPFIEQEEDTDS